MSDDGFFIGILIVIMIWVFGPTVRSVHSDNWQEAVKICEANEGLTKVEITSFYANYDVYCNNGAKFTLSTLGRE